MTVWRILAALAAVALVVGYAIGSGLWVSTNSGWYAGLTKPAWQPPDVAFGLIWPYNFVVLAAAGVVVALRGSPGHVGAWLVVAAISVGCALGWAYLFYVPHELTASGVALAAAAAVTAGLIVLTWTVSRGAAIALVPYVVWLALATSLAFGYARLNS